MTHRPKPRRRRLALLAAIATLGVVAVVATGCSSSGPEEWKTPTTMENESNHGVFPGGLYRQQDSLAARAATALIASGHARDARVADEIAEAPVAIWLGDQYDRAEVVKVVEKNLAAAKTQGATPVFVLYAIPGRDCGDYSAGGWSTTEYPRWVKAITGALTGYHATVILEPDSLAQLSNCPSETDERLPLIRQAVDLLAKARIPTYLDAGNSHWVAPATMASRLKRAGVAKTRGFFTNVASFYSGSDERAYAEKVSKRTGGAHYVIDVSRNGRGWKGTWCNPTGTGLGQAPHVTAGTTRLDALLWVKSPGTSDGTCNGGPKAGAWYPEFASQLVENRRD